MWNEIPNVFIEGLRLLMCKTGIRLSLRIYAQNNLKGMLFPCNLLTQDIPTFIIPTIFSWRLGCMQTTLAIPSEIRRKTEASPAKMSTTDETNFRKGSNWRPLSSSATQPYIYVYSPPIYNLLTWESFLWFPKPFKTRPIWATYARKLPNELLFITSLKQSSHIWLLHQKGRFKPL